MQELWQNTLQQASALLGGYVPNLLAAVAILVVGWIVARILGAVVRGALRRTTVDNRVAGWVAGEEGSADFDIEGLAGRLVFWLAMLFVLVAFFQALNLTLLTEPLNALLTEVAEFAPRLFGAAALLFLAWLLATVLRKVVRTVLSTTDLDRRLGNEADEGAELPVSKTIAEAVYWLVFLLFLPAILGALALEGLLRPVQGLTDQLLGFLPNIFAAGLILAVGWFVARLVQRIVSNLSAAAGLDRLSEQVGLQDALGEQKLSGLVGLVLYVLILIPVLISSLNALELAAVTEPASAMLAQVLDALPRLFAAGILLALAFFVGRLVSGLLSNLLAGAGFDRFMGELGIRARGQDSRPPSGIVGSLIVVAIMLFAAVEAAGLLGFAELADLVSAFIVFAGQVILGLIVFAIGLYLANLAAETISASSARNAAFLALSARISILVLAAAMGLQQMGLANEIINLAFGLLLGSIAAAVALAFGLGARDVAGNQVRRWIAAWNDEDHGADDRSPMR